MDFRQPKTPLRPQNDPKNRFKDNEVILRPARESDMIKIASVILKRFPKEFWSIFENPRTRRPDEIRAEKLAWRWDRVRRHNPDFVWLVAEIRATGEFAGVAGWHKPVKGRFNRNLWLADMPDERSKLAWGCEKRGDGKLEEQISDAWADIDLDGYLSYWAGAESNRIDILGEEAHWYLAPYAVEERFEGRGVGSHLMRWALDQADMENPPVTVYLEAADAARPVYEHFKFSGDVGASDRTIMIRR